MHHTFIVCEEVDGLYSMGKDKTKNIESCAMYAVTISLDIPLVLMMIIVGYRADGIDYIKSSSSMG